MVTHPERVLKVTGLPQAFNRWESSLKEFQRGRPAELDDDVKANAVRLTLPKQILDAADLHSQYRTFFFLKKKKEVTTCCNRHDIVLMYTWEMCAIRQRKLVQSRLE